MAKGIVVVPELEAVVASFGAYQLSKRRLAPLAVQMDSYGSGHFWLGGRPEALPAWRR